MRLNKYDSLRMAINYIQWEISSLSSILEKKKAWDEERVEELHDSLRLAKRLLIEIYIDNWVEENNVNMEDLVSYYND